MNSKDMTLKQYESYVKRNGELKLINAPTFKNMTLNVDKDLSGCYGSVVTVEDKYKKSKEKVLAKQNKVLENRSKVLERTEKARAVRKQIKEQQDKEFKDILASGKGYELLSSLKPEDRDKLTSRHCWYSVSKGDFKDYDFTPLEIKLLAATIKTESIRLYNLRSAKEHQEMLEKRGITEKEYQTERAMASENHWEDAKSNPYSRHYEGDDDDSYY